MSCPTCTHTMQRLDQEQRIFWCPRCGTLKYHMVEDRFNDEPPMLVSRCRQFSQSNGEGWDWKKLWHKFGIDEAINPPGREMS